MKKILLANICIFALALSACTSKGPGKEGKVTSAPQETELKKTTSKENGIEISKDNDGLVLAYAQVGDLESLELVMKNGTYSYDHYSFKSCYSGEFYLQYYQENTMISEKRIEGLSDEQAVFDSYFHIDTQDYNKDGYLDFLIGQEMSEVGTYYRMYSLIDGKIEQLDLGTEENVIYAFSNQANYELKRCAKDTWEYEQYIQGKGSRKIKIKWDGNKFEEIEKGSFSTP